MQPDSPEIAEGLDDLQVVRLVGDWDDTKEVVEGEIEIAGSLGGQLLLWEYATVVAGRLHGINPFDQPDVEAAKVAARELIDNPTPPKAPAFTAGDIEVRGTDGVVTDSNDLASVVSSLLSYLDDDGYVAIQAYADRTAYPELAEIRERVAARARRPVTFGWGPRFLHSTGQFHKGGPAVGVFLQIIVVEESDLQIPDRPFTFGELIRAQAAGDASVLAGHGRPVLSLTVSNPEVSLPLVLDAIG